MINVRTKGHNFERAICRELKPYFPECITARAGAIYKDAQGIDVINTGEYNIQCKAKQAMNVFKVLSDEMPIDDNINLVFWKRDRQKDIVCLSKTDFYKILEQLQDIDVKDHRNLLIAKIKQRA